MQNAPIHGKIDQNQFGMISVRSPIYLVAEESDEYIQTERTSSEEEEEYLSEIIEPYILWNNQPSFLTNGRQNLCTWYNNKIEIFSLPQTRVLDWNI